MSKTQARIKKLSDIASDIAQIALASVVVPFLVDRFNPAMILLGLTTALTFWTISLLLTR